MEKKNIMKMDRAELREYAEQLSIQYNSAYQQAEYADAADIDDVMQQVVNRYTAIISEEYYDKLKTADDPMYEAALEPKFQTIRITDKKDRETKIPVREIVDGQKKIDIRKLYKEVPGGIGYDKEWIWKVEKLNLMMLLRVSKEVNSKRKPEEIKDSFAMSDMARKVKLGEIRLSNSNMLRELNEIIKAMIGPKYSAFSHDVRYLDLVYAREDTKKDLTIKCASSIDLMWYLLQICHRIVTNGRWDISCRDLKNK